MKSKTGKIVCFAVSAVILAIILALDIAVGFFREALDRYVVGYKSDGDSTTAARAEGEKLAEQIQQEGTVLVRNEGNVLPLADSAEKKVNVFGWSSVAWIYSGSGSGQVAEGKVDLYGALDEYGVAYNTALKQMYTNFRARRENTVALETFSYEFCRLYEPSINDKDFYTDTLLENAKDFSDVALVVLSRVTGETNDATGVQYKRVTKDGAVQTDTSRTYLEISTEEEELLNYVGKNFDKVVVLINSTNVMELGFLESIDGLDACLIVGPTGSAAATAIPKILYGTASPTGKTVDTYAYDLTTAPSYANAPKGLKGTGGIDTNSFYTDTMNGSKQLYPLGTQFGQGSTKVDYSGVAFTDYAEGIYVGYKWYETADAEGFWTSQTAKDTWDLDGYDKVVQYPFGYGLSYTEFSWTVNRAWIADGDEIDRKSEIKFQITVTNTGTRAGQDVVEVYYTPPYSRGGIEKASVNLVAFAKTKQILGPNESEVVEVSFPASDMKSYDCYDANRNGFCGYELEAGDYVISLRSDAHTLAGDKIVGGKAEYTYRVPDTVKIANDEKTNEPVANLFTGEDAKDGVAIDGNSDGTAEITYLTRSDMAGTFPFTLAASRAMDSRIKELNLYTETMAKTYDMAQEADPITTGSKEGDAIVCETIVDGNKTITSITDLGVKLGKDFDAPEWEVVLDHLTIAEMTSMTLHCYHKTNAMSSVGKPELVELDGPNQAAGYKPPAGKKAGTGFSMVLLAQSWNTQLAYSMGLTFGTESAAQGITGWYGPGVNLHRTPFGGRNWEYYSEDAFLSGVMASNEIRAAKNAGVYSYVKHLCLYESDTARDGMYNWTTEQTLRELYLKPFEICVKDGATGIMTSFSRLGAVWAGGSHTLLTDLVRGEWGFKGSIITDYSDYNQYMNGDHMLRAGGDLWMDHYNDSGEYKFNTNSAAFQNELRRAAKDELYTWLNALATNKDYNADEDNIPIIVSASELNFRWYIPVLVVVNVLAVAGCGVWVFLTLKKKDKQQNTEPETPSGV